MNFSARSWDWKFLVNCALAIIGVVVTIWVWQSDLKPRSLSARVSTVPLRVLPSVSDLQVTLDGVVVESPYVSIITLTNNGQKPIPTGDFESPIILTAHAHAHAGVKVVRANVSATPDDLKALLITGNRDVKVSPMLLNPGDELTVAVITSGGPPRFRASARIAGIPKIDLQDELGQIPSIWDRILSLPLFVVLSVGYGIFLVAVFRPEAITLNRWMAATACLACGLSSASSIKYLFLAFDFQRSLYWEGGATAAIVIPLFLYVRYRSRPAPLLT